MSDKPKCPNCGVELEGTPEACAKCGFDLKTYPSFYSFFKTAMKQMKQEDEAAETERKKKEAEKKPTGVMDSLLGRKKA